VHQSSINHISFQNGYVVTAGADGNVRFFDAKMRIAAWFEDILDGEGGQILAVSFSGSLPQVVSASKKEFVVPDFMVATDTGRIISLSANMYGSLRREDRFGHVIHEAVPRDILHISSSRTQTSFWRWRAGSCRSGTSIPGRNLPSANSKRRAKYPP